MIPSPFAQDDCKSGAEALARARAGHARRVAGYERQPVAPPAPKPEPPPVIVVARPKVPPPPAPAPEPVPPGEPEWRVPSLITIRAVIRAACAHFDIPYALLVSPMRGDGLPMKRQIAFFIAAIVTAKSLPEIGRAFGNRDHTTILHGIRKIRSFLEAGDPEIIAAREAILERLGLPPDYAMSRRDCVDWTDEDIAVLKAGWNVRDIQEMAIELQRSAGAISSKGARMGLSPRMNPSPAHIRWPLWNERLAELAAGDLSARQIAIRISEEARVYVGKATVLRQMDKLGIRRRKSRLLGAAP